MKDESIIQLENIRNSFYEKGIDLVNVHLYIREVEEHEIVFEESKVICKFSTQNSRFIKLHTGGNHKKHAFSYTINTKESIVISGCSYQIKEPFIEIILKKKVAQKWNRLCLHPFKQNSANKGSKSEIKQVVGTKRHDSQLLGGKSTPVKTNDENKQSDTQTPLENRSIQCNGGEDEKNIKKAANQFENSIGLTGLENYANNCYMNVVLQVLANIQETRDYFKNDHYLKDVNADNPLSSGGKVVKAFADVTKALWTVRKNAFKPSALKNIMGKRYSLFLGWQQHDAQEFFSSLLDNLHEDLNHPEKIDKDRETKPDLADSSANEKTDTAWLAHWKRNNSFIVKLFHGQLMSKLTCASCHKVSFSFDPCAQISLPIPTNKKLSLKILFFLSDNKRKPQMVSMQISTPNAKVWHLRHMLQSIVNVPSHLISVFNGIQSICLDDQIPVISIRKSKYIVTAELPNKDATDFIYLPVFQYVKHNGHFVQCDNCLVRQSDSVSLKRCTRCLAVAYCTRECQTKHWHDVHSKVCCKDLKMQVGLPFYITVKRDLLTMETLEEHLRVKAKFSVETLPSNLQNDVDQVNHAQNLLGTSSSPSFIIKISSKPNNNSAVVLSKDNFSHELLSKTSSLILEWDNTSVSDGSYNVKSRDIPVYEEFTYDGNTGMSDEEDQCSIYDCLRLFMEPESLDKKDSWKCPKCKNLQAAKKEMAISIPPGLLLLHLKRFTYGDFGQKINKAVSYPLSNFDLTPFIAKEVQSKIDHPLIYNLCGVITHKGSMRMGHYTCLVRTLGIHDEEEVGWRYFDDDSVMNIASDKVLSSDAYVLVYRIKGAHETLKLGSLYTDNYVKTKNSDASGIGCSHEDNFVESSLDLMKQDYSKNKEEHNDDDNMITAEAGNNENCFSPIFCAAKLFPTNIDGNVSNSKKQITNAEEKLISLDQTTETNKNESTLATIDFDELSISPDTGKPNDLNYYSSSTQFNHENTTLFDKYCAKGVSDLNENDLD